MKKLLTLFFEKVYAVLCPKPLSAERVSHELTTVLNSDEPCLISRIGSVEFQLLAYHKYYPLFLLFKKRTMHNAINNAGFFSISKNNNKRFCELYINNFRNIDILISWRFEEFFFRKEFSSALKVDKNSFDLFFVSNTPWTKALVGKRVLVIHPFADTIEKQYNERRSLLYKNPDVLPEFKSLETIKAILSLAGNKTAFKDWFEAFEYMKSEMDKCDYDVAIIGCGAYGFPLAAYAKQKGKKAIHMGGVTQFLFGIKGKRYIDNEVYAKYINEYFVFPPEKDRPVEADKVEGGCYW